MVVTLVAKAAWGLGVVKGSPCTFLDNIPDFCCSNVLSRRCKLQPPAQVKGGGDPPEPANINHKAGASKPRPTNPGNPTTPPLPLPSAGSIKSRGSNAVKAGMEWEGQLGGGGDRGRRELQGPGSTAGASCCGGMRPRSSTPTHPMASPFQRWATRTSSPPPLPFWAWMDG